MTPAEELERALAEAPCVVYGKGMCLSPYSVTHPQCALRALRNHFASEEVRSRARHAAYVATEGLPDVSIATFVVGTDAYLAALGLGPVDA